MQPPVYDSKEARIRRLEAQVGRLLQDSRIGASFTGPLPESASALGLRRTGVYYPSNTLNILPTFGGSAPGADVLNAVPFYVPDSSRIADRIAIEIATGAAGNIRLGIYDSDRNLYPGRLLLDAGATSTASASLKEMTIRQGLTRGLKWLAMVQSGTALLRRISPAAPGIWAPLGFNASTEQVTVNWYVAFNYAALPAKFPVGAGGGQWGPVIYLRFAV